MAQANLSAHPDAFADDTVGDCLDRIRRAWDAGSARAYAAEFAADATCLRPWIGLGEE